MTKLRFLRLLEWGMLVPGLAGVTIYGAGQFHARVTQDRAARALDDAMTVSSATPAPAPVAGAGASSPAPPPPSCPSVLTPCAPLPVGDPAWRAQILGIPDPDKSSWAQGRRECHARALAELNPDIALARLDIPAISLSVVVLPGIDALCLNGGVGHIPGTPPPGKPGNVGIAGHRDGFFRGLERIAKGHVMRLTTPRGAFEYRVQWIKIVEPRDVEVLAATGDDAITLVTCHPFRVLGQAPKRFIVHATCAGTE